MKDNCLGLMADYDKLFGHGELESIK